MTEALARAGGAAVMGTGIVSTALSLDGHETTSRVLLVIAAVLLVGVAAALVRNRSTLADASRTPAALTWVAATDVVGARLSILGWHGVAAGLLALAVALWLLLVPRVLARWRRRTVGVSFLLAVATESIAVLAARLAVAGGLHWLAYPALAWFALGLVSYVIVLAGFDMRELGVGRGDHWIAGGALAIAALACARCAQAVAMHDLRFVVLAVWAAAAAWLPALVITELVRPRRVFHELRWSTVFPLGMYAACSFAAGAVAHVTALTAFARLWVWVAVGGWAAVAAATARRAA